MAYDPNKEKILASKEVKLENGWKTVSKVYTYGEGEPKFKVLFKSETANGAEFVTAKFPGLTDKKGVANLIKAMQEVSKEL